MSYGSSKILIDFFKTSVKYFKTAFGSSYSFFNPGVKTMYKRLLSKTSLYVRAYTILALISLYLFVHMWHG